MRNIRLTIEYDGAGYAGWQAQKNSRKTIQETIEHALWKILKERVNLIASGRTDAGVHALAQTANFKTESRLPAINLQKALNKSLPGDIVISRAEDAALGFHSRFDAKSKLYRYYLLNRPYRSAFLRNRACFYRYPLNVNLMRRAARYLLGRHDFKAFCASGSGAKDTVRTMKRIIVRKPLAADCLALRPADCICIDIEADGFLYNMARSIVGALTEAGRGAIPPQAVKEALRTKDKSTAGPTMPAQGLYLVKVKY